MLVASKNGPSLLTLLCAPSNNPCSTLFFLLAAGSHGLGPWYFDMEERLRNPYFLGSRGWNGPIESWVGKNKVCVAACNQSGRLYKHRKAECLVAPLTSHPAPSHLHPGQIEECPRPLLPCVPCFHGCIIVCQQGWVVQSSTNIIELKLFIEQFANFISGVREL